MKILKNICAPSILGLFPLDNGIDWKGKKNQAAEARAFSYPSHFLIEKTLGTRVIFASIVNFSIHDVDGSEIVIFKMNSRFFKLFCIYFKCRRISLKLISWGPHSSLERERKIRRRLFTSSIKREIRHWFSSCSRVGTAKKCTKTKACKIVVLLDKPFPFWRSRSRPRRRRLSSLMLVWDRNSWHCKYSRTPIFRSHKGNRKKNRNSGVSK